MEHKQIYSFDSIAKYRIFSKQSHGYEKVLGNRTLKAFIRSLKRPKINTKKLSFLEELLIKYPKAQKEMEEHEAEFLNEHQDNSLLEKYNVNKHKEDKFYKIYRTEKILNDKEKNSENVTEIINMIQNKRKPIIKIDKSPDKGVDGFKYNPNYNSIFKYIPCARLDRPSYSNNRNKNSKFIKKKNNSINSNRNFNKSLDNQTKSLISNTNPNINNNIVNTNNNIINNNHNFNSENCSSAKKKNIFITKKNNELNYTHIKAGSYIDKKINDVIKLPKIKKEKIYVRSEKNFKTPKKINTFSFKKMTSRKEKDMIYIQSLDTPSFYNYSPNYNYIEKSPMNISFDSNHEMPENDKKKFLMKKLWTSYHVDLGYHLITNSNWK